jgi:hypothetical protein
MLIFAGIKKNEWKYPGKESGDGKKGGTVPWTRH